MNVPKNPQEKAPGGARSRRHLHTELHSYPLLFALRQVLLAHSVATRLEGLHALVVIAPEGDQEADRITVRPRTDDADRLWFFDREGQPVEETEKVPDAAIKIAASLGSRA